MSESERKRFGADIRAERRALRLSQAEVARLAHLTQTQVSRIETGTINAQIDTVSRICRALGKALRLSMV